VGLFVCWIPDSSGARGGDAPESSEWMDGATQDRSGLASGGLIAPRAPMTNA